VCVVLITTTAYKVHKHCVAVCLTKRYGVSVIVLIPLGAVV
jgi:hypothetical protein